VNDPDLLEKYEPVLRFAKSERFFPMAVEPYLEECILFPDGPGAFAELVTHMNVPLPERIGKLQDEQYFLRFVNDPLSDSDAWMWWGLASLLGIGSAWYFSGTAAAELAFAASAITALIIFMIASPIRLRIIPAALTGLVFIALEAAPIWFFLRPGRYVNVTVEYLILLPFYLIFLFYLSVRTMKFILERVVPEGPGMIMDILSQATEKVARQSYLQYEKMLEKDPQPLYYGRVLRELDGNHDRWTILQYHFFYAFNDWRLAANGMNHHEGDWEMTAVYLKNEEPYAVLFSQHGAGAIEKWQAVRKAVDKSGNETDHPVVYVALGSHANYSKPEVIRSPAMYTPGKLQRFLFRMDGLIRYLFMLFSPSRTARQMALKEIQSKRMNFLAGEAFIYLRDEADHYVAGLPMEIACGDGFRVGFQGDNLREAVLKSGSYLRRVMSERRTTRPKVREWRRVLLNPEPDWVQYKGLWGVKSLLQDESGPPGPKWDRPRKDQAGVKERMRWGRPLKWLAELERLAH
jgi:hypothetical protein